MHHIGLNINNVYTMIIIPEKTLNFIKSFQNILIVEFVEPAYSGLVANSRGHPTRLSLVLAGSATIGRDSNAITTRVLAL